MNRLALPSLALAAVLAVGGCSSSEMAASGGNPDAHFMTETGHASSSELALSQLAVERASDPAVKQYAQMMVSDHTQQNQQLATLGKQKGMTVPARPDELHAKGATFMRQLSGAQFDREYMSAMVADHAKLLSKVQDKAATAQDPQVRAWAAAQVPILRAHLDQARQIHQRLGGASTVGAMAAGSGSGTTGGTGTGGMGTTGGGGSGGTGGTGTTGGGGGGGSGGMGGTGGHTGH